MKIVSTSYTNTSEFKDPQLWLKRIGFYSGILEELAKGNEVESIEQIDYEGCLKSNGVTYHFLNFKKRKLYFPRSLHRFIQKIGPDVILVNGFIFPLQIIQLRRAVGKSVKIIVIHRSEKPFNGIKKHLQRLAEKRVNAFLFASSEFGEQWITNGNLKDPTKIHEVLHGSSWFVAEDKVLSRSLLSVSGSPVYLWVGRLDKNKDPLTMLKAFIRFLRVQPLAKLYMIYHEEILLKEATDLIKEDILASKAIMLVGKVLHAQLQTWYSAADFIISASHYEGGGIAICEAMSCGCIPVITDIPSFRRMTGPGKCGLLFKPGDTEELFKVLVKTRELDRQEERKKVLRQFHDELSFAAIAQKIEHVIANS